MRWCVLMCFSERPGPAFSRLWPCHEGSFLPLVFLESINKLDAASQHFTRNLVIRNMLSKHTYT